MIESDATSGGCTCGCGCGRFGNSPTGLCTTCWFCECPPRRAELDRRELAADAGELDD